MLSNSHGGALVTGDRDEYVGVVDFTSVTDHMRLMEEQAEASMAEQPGPETERADG